MRTPAALVQITSADYEYDDAYDDDIVYGEH